MNTRNNKLLDAISPVSIDNRFDIIMKYIYARDYHLNVDSLWSEELYIEHIRSFNGFIEGTGSEKLGKDEFINSFIETLQSIETNGFNSTFGKIPLGSDNTPTNGAHRLAACILHGKKPDFEPLQALGPVYDYKFFADRGLAHKFLDQTAIEYSKLEKNSFLLFIFPSINEITNDGMKIIENVGEVIYKKEISLTITGQTRLMRQLYKGENWVGAIDDEYSGAQRKAKWCFQGKNDVQIFLLKSNLDALIQAKLEFRELYGMGNHSIHSTDTQEETIRISQQVFNKNSIHFINNAKEKGFSKYTELLTAYKGWLKESDVDQDHFCIDTSTVMAAYGMRDSRDLDYINLGEGTLDCPNAEIGNHNSELQYHPATKDEIICNPSCHFYYDGVKYASLDIIKEMKKNRNEVKDRHDIQLIDSFLKGKSEPTILLLKIKIRKMCTKTYVLSRLRDLKLLLQMLKLKLTHKIKNG